MGKISSTAGNCFQIILAKTGLVESVHEKNTFFVATK
jgi:hypothetical protein